MKRALIALDISKNNTGVCITIMNSETGVLDFHKITSIHHPHRAKLTKMYFIAGNYLKAELRKIVKDLKEITTDIQVAFEYPIFGSATSSELQFYLFQCMLDTFQVEAIDCVGYTTSFLKSFATQCMTTRPFKYEKGKKTPTSVRFMKQTSHHSLQHYPHQKIFIMTMKWMRSFSH